MVKSFLFVDKDDVIVRSSPLIQKEVNQKTFFKTERLVAYEQLIRNCEYCLDYVKNAYNDFINKGIFDQDVLKICSLSTIPFSDDMNYDKKCLFFEEGIKTLQKALHVSKCILEDFLEERDVFLENDNLEAGCKYEYDYAKEIKSKNEFQSMVFNIYPQLMDNCSFCLEKITNICMEAKKINHLPNYESLVKNDSNDIIKMNNGKIESDRSYLLYEKPIEDVELSRKYLNNFFIDARRTSSVRVPSRAITDYFNIYTVENTNSDVVEGIKELLQSNYFEGIYELSHHNGGREEIAKKELNMFLFDDKVPFLGLRFHKEKHDAKRRGRNSKAEFVMENITSDLSNCYLIDDSMANIRDWINHGGVGILYKPYTEKELATGILDEFDCYRIPNFSKELIMEIVNNHEKKEGKVIKKV